MSSDSVGVIFPSRGLIFSKTAEEMLSSLKGHDYKIYFSHRLPIPDCFEKPLTEALRGSHSHIWLVEDDMMLPDGILDEMLAVDKAVVVANYPTTKRGDSSILTVKNRIVYAGTGCTLVKREVFDELKAPYFRTDIAWVPKNYGDYLKFTGVKKGDKGYGLHDVNFFMNLYRLNIPIHRTKTELGQRKLRALGKAGSNDGAHSIDEWTKVKKDRYHTLIKGLPISESGNLASVLVDGKELATSKAHAQKLIKKGIGEKPPKRSVIIDDSGAL